MMEGWKEISFGKIATFRNGLNFKRESQGRGCYIIGIPDFKDYFTPIYETLGEINPHGVVKEQDYIQRGDILFVRSNGNKELVGRSLFIDKDVKCVFSGFCIRARITSDIASPKFFAYYTRTNIFRGLISAASGGANIQNLNQGILNRIKVPFPPLQTQRKIASILSAYDNLIENNLKRIKLLEEQAQQTYEEWFVRFKFPGYETAVFDKDSGLPVGWMNSELEQFTNVLKGKNITKATIKHGFVPVVAGGLNPAYYHNRPNTINPVITVSASGANAGFVNLYLEDIWASDCSYIDSEMTDSLFYIYCSLLNKQKLIYHLQKGAAQPHVYPKDLKTVDIIVPTNEVLNNFESLVSKNYHVKRNLLRQNQLLKEARDILLPRLMMGIIDPSARLGQDAESLDVDEQLGDGCRGAGALQY